MDPPGMPRSADRTWLPGTTHTILEKPREAMVMTHMFPWSGQEMQMFPLGLCEGFQKDGI